MADTLPNVPLPRGVWVDLYAATGIAVGDQIDVQNLGDQEVLLVTKATEPTDADGYFRIGVGEVARNDLGEAGLWARCITSDGVVQVAEAL